MTRAARWAYLILAWAFLVGLVAQVFFAGLGMFGASSFELHVGFGWMLHLVPLLVLPAAALARAGRRHWQWALALAIVVFVVPIVVLMRESVPALAALHPVAAVVASWLAIVVVRNAMAVDRRTDDASSAVEAPA